MQRFCSTMMGLCRIAAWYCAIIAHSHNSMTHLIINTIHTRATTWLIHATLTRVTVSLLCVPIALSWYACMCSYIELRVAVMRVDIPLPRILISAYLLTYHSYTATFALRPILPATPIYSPASPMSTIDNTHRIQHNATRNSIYEHIHAYQLLLSTPHVVHTHI